jgi:hypothetical protein
MLGKAEKTAMERGKKEETNGGGGGRGLKIKLE